MEEINCRRLGTIRNLEKVYRGCEKKPLRVVKIYDYDDNVHFSRSLSLGLLIAGIVSNTLLTISVLGILTRKVL